MFYGILTNAGEGGAPFKKPDTPPTAPGNTLRLSPEATLLAFETQPSWLFASKYARAYSKILWSVDKKMLHRDDLPAAEVFGSCHDFQVWLSCRDRNEQEL